MKKTILILFFLIISSFSLMSATLYVEVVKPGGLKKSIKDELKYEKEILSNIDTLVVLGNLDDSDIQYLSSLHQLKYLRLRLLSFTSNTGLYSSIRGDDSVVINMPYLPNLSEFWISPIDRDFFIDSEDNKEDGIKEYNRFLKSATNPNKRAEAIVDLSNFSDIGVIWAGGERNISFTPKDNRRLKVRVLCIEEDEEIRESLYDIFDPDLVICSKNIVLRNWNLHLEAIVPDFLDQVVSFSSGCFREYDEEELIIDHNVFEFSPKAFEGSNIKKLIVNGSILKICSNVFDGSNIQEFTVDGDIANICSNAFAGSEIERITINGNPYMIDRYGFNGANVKELIIDNNEPLRISDYAFAKSNIEKFMIKGNVVDIHDGAFANSTLRSLDVGSVNIFNYGAFRDSNVEDVYFRDEKPILESLQSGENFIKFGYVDENEERYLRLNHPDYLESLNSIRFHVPSTTFFLILERNSDICSSYNIVTDGEKKPEYAISIDVKEPDHILSYISLAEMSKLTALTIKGVLYDSDMALIRKNCKNLKFLDMRHAVMIDSPEQIRAEKDELEFYKGLFQAMSSTADLMYENYEMSTAEYNSVQPLTMLYNLLDAADDIPSVNESRIPKGCFAGMNHLTTLYLPLTAKSIGENAFSGCHLLEEIEFPNDLETLTASFVGCYYLKRLSFPKTLRNIKSVVNNSNQLSEIEFNGPVNKFDFKVENCKRLLSLNIPEGVEHAKQYVNEGSGLSIDLYFPSTIKTWYVNRRNSSNSRWHFKNPVAPSYKGGQQDASDFGLTIIIPHGSMTSYYNQFKKCVTYIEE